MATFTTTGGVDTFNGGASNDLFIANQYFPAGTIFSGGGGIDTLRFLASSMVPPAATGAEIPLALGLLANISGIEKLHLASQSGQQLNVLLTIGQLNSFNTITGGAGADFIIATTPTGGGTFSLKSFTLQTWAADDMVSLVVGTGTGNYTLNASSHSAGIQGLGGGAGNDTLNGTSGREDMSGGGGTNTLNGLAGDDRFHTGLGVDAVNAGDGNDQVDVEGTVVIGSNYKGGAGTDTLQINLTAQSDTDNGPMFLGTSLTFSGFERLDFDSAPGERLTAVFRLGQLAEITELHSGDGNASLFMLAPDGGGSFTLRGFTFTGWNPGNVVGLVVGEASGNYLLSAANHEGLYLLGGGAGDDRLTGTDGAEILNGGAGRDLINGKNGFDIINGGAGTDTLTYVDAGSAVTVKLNITAQQDTGGAGPDTITNIENLIGSGFGDTLVGNDTANQLKGGLGADKLIGGKGKDALFGGVDSLRDTFVFQLSSDSKTGERRDQLYDFVSGTDKINLAAIDANTEIADNQAFVFAGAAAANAIWISDIGADLVVAGDVNGDAVADFEIQVMARNTVVAGDFIL